MCVSETCSINFYYGINDRVSQVTRSKRLIKYIQVFFLLRSTCFKLSVCIRKHIRNLLVWFYGLLTFYYINRLY